MMKKRLESLRADYAAVAGFPFRHFFCPIMWADEDADLCRGHIVNKSFRDTDRSWTVQRADVDNWFGTLFENDFLSIEQKGQPVIEQALTDKDFFRRFRPNLTVDGTDVPYYIAQSNVSPKHTVLEADFNGRIVQIGMKLSPDEVLSRLEGTWKFETDKDIRLPALVSVLKSAHLTMFHLLGYRYALLVGGYFVGKIVLGDLYMKARGKERQQALRLAYEHCQPFVNMVRPVIEMPSDHLGTVTDRIVHFLMSEQHHWAFVVYVRTGSEYHAAVLPIMDHADSAARFHRFLESSSETIGVRIGRMGPGEIGISAESYTVEWPATRFDTTPSEV